MTPPCPNCSKPLTYVSLVQEITGFSYQRAVWDRQTDTWLTTDMPEEKYSPDITDEVHHAYACPSCDYLLDDHLTENSDGDLIINDPEVWPDEMMESAL